jgi:hypothetical protein
MCNSRERSGVIESNTDPTNVDHFTISPELRDNNHLDSLMHTSTKKTVQDKNPSFTAAILTLSALAIIAVPVGILVYLYKKWRIRESIPLVSQEISYENL